MKLQIPQQRLVAGLLVLYQSDRSCEGPDFTIFYSVEEIHPAKIVSPPIRKDLGVEKTSGWLRKSHYSQIINTLYVRRKLLKCFP